MQQRIVYTLIDNRLPALARKITMLLLMVYAPIAFGALIDSAAMQWFGFMTGIVLVLAYANRKANENSFDSIEGLQAHLETMKNETSGKDTDAPGGWSGKPFTLN